ncbi:extracellular solute-binding protein [Chloroflexi bacterium TSY]|nr:extracellular solute-binding protein [Chloroflexi bacterium TSY]
MSNKMHKATRGISRRRFLQFSSMTATAVLLAACPAAAPAPSAGGDGGAGTEETIEVEAWAHWEQGLDWLDNAMTDFGFYDENPNISFKKTVAPFSEIHDKMLAACASGVGLPDIMRVEQGRAAAFFKGEEICFVEMNDLIGDRMDNLVPGSATDYWTWQGKIYGIGNEVNACTLAYRKSVFDEVGIKTPFETWQEVREAGFALKEAKPDMSIISWHDLHDGDFQMMLFNAGEQMFLEDGNFGGMNDIGKEILEFQRGMIHDDEIAITAPNATGSTWGSPIFWEAFRQDQVATVMGAPWFNGKLGRENLIGPSQEGEWRLQALPNGFGADVPTATHGGTSVSIPKGAANVEAAWSIIEFTHLTDAVLQDVIERGIIPSWIPAIENELVQEPYDYYAGQNTGALYLELAESMPRIFQSPWAPEFHTAFTNLVITPVIQENASDYDALFDELGIELERIKSL